MKIDIITLFPEMFKGPFDTSMVKKAKDIDAVEINIHNLRGWTKDKHKTVDDKPFGGGKGMVLKVEPIHDALQELQKTEGRRRKTDIDNRKQKVKISSQSSIILLTPQGKVFNQQAAERLSKLNHIILIAGHYEGFDERIRENLINEEVSIGDYVLTGGEIPAMVIVDSIVRLIPGVLEPEAKFHESFSTRNAQRATEQTFLDFPTYTRPANFKGWKVPEVLLSGNHAEIEKWRKKKTIEATKQKRPDLLKK